jgi:hypothetical protein
MAPKVASEHSLELLLPQQIPSIAWRPSPLGEVSDTMDERPIQNQLSDWEMAVTEIPVQFRL